jgi:hypothetical protein
LVITRILPKQLIEEQHKEGWRLHTYQAIGASGASAYGNPTHYLLFEKKEKTESSAKELLLQASQIS